MRLEYTLNLNDYRAAQNLALHQDRIRWVVHFSLFQCLPVLACAAGILVGRKLGIFFTGLPSAVVFAGGLILGYLINAVVAPLSDSQRHASIYRRRFPFGPPTFSVEISQNGFSTETPGADRVFVDWDSIVLYVQSDDMALFFLGNKRFFSIPTTALSPDQLTEINVLVKSHGVKKIKC